VTFALSSPKVVQWRVDFGDGQSKVAIGQPPSSLEHTYKTRGDYRPRLTVITSPTATTSSSATTSVQVGTALMSLTTTPASGNPPLKVTFTLGTSVQNITTWSVAFGDGQRTAGGGKPPASVSHTYTKAGSYRVVFSVKPGQYALVAAFAQVTVGGGTPPVLSLSATPTSGTHPLAVTFTLGTNIPGKIVSWQLQFGDGQRAGGSGKPPATVSHTYAKAGTYRALLIVAQQQQYGGVQYVVPRGGLVISIR
jgi:PKD repeat protein